MDFTGCGNTLNMQHPRVLQLIMDSLRYWVLEMHVDGFRFDLASTLARELYEVDKLGAFFDIIHQDPVLSQVKLIAEPWDVGPGGYQVGNFPVLWTEWNGKYRDCRAAVLEGRRRHGVASSPRGWRAAATCTSRAAGSPYASINFVTCHDGFTLHDLVSYNHKHNDANGEGNRDGTDDNLSWNCGARGADRRRGDPGAARAADAEPDRDGAAVAGRADDPRRATSWGRRQNGNNNAYCQDNELSWLDWTLNPNQRDFLGFVRRVIRIWREHPVLQRRRFFQGRSIRGSNVKDVSWILPSGAEMGDHDWAGFVRCFGMRLAGDRVDEVDERGRRIEGDTILMVLNAHHEGNPVHLAQHAGRPRMGVPARHQPPDRPAREQPRSALPAGAAVAGGVPDAAVGGGEPSAWRFRWGPSATGGSGGCDERRPGDIVCWFITVGLDAKRTAAIEAIGRERDGFGVRPSVNPHLATLFPASDARFEITHGQCSCDLVGREETDSAIWSQVRRRNLAASRVCSLLQRRPGH